MTDYLWKYALIVLIAAISTLTGCITQPPPPPPLPELSAAPQEQKSVTTYATITSTLVKGKTSQSELLNMFGGPNIATTDSDGTETWVYEEKSTSSTSQNQAAASARIDAMTLFFGIGAAQQATAQANGQSSATTTISSKSLTFIVKFNNDKTVKDFSVRQSSF